MALTNWKASENAQKFLPLLNATEVQHGIPPDLLARMAYQESHFRSDIIYGDKPSSAGALGIMQIVPRFHPDVNPRDPIASIKYAGEYLASLYAQFRSWPLAVAAYNAGPGNVVKHGNQVPPFAETRRYVDEVFTDLKNAYPQSMQMYA